MDVLLIILFILQLIFNIYFLIKSIKTLTCDLIRYTI